MTAYTEAHFAATLLNCGPHRLSANKTPNPYRDRVYMFFFDLFPEHETQCCSAHHNSTTDDWEDFWRDYIKWVEQ